MHPGPQEYYWLWSRSSELVCAVAADAGVLRQWNLDPK